MFAQIDSRTTNQKGTIAETAIAARAVRLGIEVYRPVGEGGRFDFLFLWPDDRIERIQCKWAPLRQGAVIVRTYSARRTRDGMHQTKLTLSSRTALSSTAVIGCLRQWQSDDGMSIFAWIPPGMARARR